MSKEGKLLPITEISKQVQVSTATLARAARLGNLPADKIGRDWLTTLEAATTWKTRYYKPRMKRK